MPLSSDLPLIAVYNNAGAIAVQAEKNKNDAERTRLLTQGADFLGQASKSAPTDPMVHFNYGYALFLAGKYSEAAEHFRPVIASDQQDGQAYFLFSKSLAKLGNTKLQLPPTTWRAAISEPRMRSGKRSGRSRKPPAASTCGCETC